MRITTQGQLIAIAGYTPHNAKPRLITGGKRGVVCGLSVSSRRRLLRVGAALRPNASALLVTLTAVQGTPDDTIRQWYNAFRERMRRAYPAAAWIWRVERQENGTLHYHLLLFNLDRLPGGWLWDTWESITGSRQRVDVRRARNQRAVVRYISKYIAKRDGGIANPSLVDVSYLHANPEPIRGRQWGMHNRAMIPWSETVTFDTDDYDLVGYACWWITRGLFRRAESWRGNMTAMTDKAAQWFAHLARLAAVNPTPATLPLVC